jgi:hypothetical protein
MNTLISSEHAVGFNPPRRALASTRPLIRHLGHASFEESGDLGHNFLLMRYP